MTRVHDGAPDGLAEVKRGVGRRPRRYRDLTGPGWVDWLRPGFMTSVHFRVSDDELVTDRVLVVHDEAHGRARPHAEVIGAEVAVSDSERDRHLSGPKWCAARTIRSGQ